MERLQLRGLDGRLLLARRGARCAAFALALAGALGPRDLTGRGAEEYAPPRNPLGGAPSVFAEPADGRFLGLSHVDLLDLHVRRDQGGSVVPAEILAPAALATRYGYAVRSGANLHRWSLYWDMLQGEARAWDAADAILARDHEAGLASLLILQGIPPELAEGAGDQTPAFEAAGNWRPVGTVTGLHEPVFVGPNGPTDDPAEAKALNPGNPWARFVDEAAARYAPGGTLPRARGWRAGEGVTHWQIGNEPNGELFWRGTPAAYVRLLEVASVVLHRRDPGAIVVHAGIADTGDAEAWYARFAAALRARASVSPLPARHGYYFDVAAWHLYNTPRRLGERVQAGRAILAAAGLPAKPIWVTEFGLPLWSEYPGPCWDAASPQRGTAVEQATYLWQVGAEGLASGVERLLYFQLYDDCGNGESSYDALGLVRNDTANQCWVPPAHDPGCWRLDPTLAGTARPAFEAFVVAARELAGARLISRTPPSAPHQRLTFQRSAGTRVTVAWASGLGSGSVSVEPTGTEATLYRIEDDGSVSTRSVSPTASGYEIGLPASTNRNNGSGGPMVGGRAAILVEHDTAPPLVLLSTEEVAGGGVALVLDIRDPGGVAAYRLFRSAAPVAQPSDWRRVGGVEPWTGPATGGRLTVAIAGRPGETAYFAAHARDAGGRWSALEIPGFAVRFPEPSATDPPPSPGASGSAPPRPIREIRAPGMFGPESPRYQ